MTYVSVLVPSYRRPIALDRCLAALSDQDLRATRAIEVVVVADGDDGDAGPVVERHAAGGLDVRLVAQAHAGPAAARNRAAREATGRWLAFTDDDCAPRPGWLMALTAALERHPAALVGGRVYNGHPDQPAAEAAHVLLDVLVKRAQRAGDPAAFFPTSTLALAASVFDTLGGFNETFSSPGGEDREFCLRARDDGHPLVLVEAAGIDHFHAMRTAELWRQQHTYGRGAALLAVQRVAAGHGLPRVQPGFYVALARTAIGRRPARRSLVVAANIALTQVAYACGIAHEATCRWRARRYRRAG